MASSKKSAPQSKAKSTAAPAKRSKYLIQSDVPGYALFDALRIPQAISDQYGKEPTRPLEVAKALNILPTSGGFRGLTGAAVAYGLTDGGPYAEAIGITDLGLRIVSPLQEGDEVAAKLEALLKPRVIREFLEKYDGSKLPSPQIGRNVLETMGVPADKTERTLQLILGSAESLGLLTEIRGHKHVNLQGGRSLATALEGSAGAPTPVDDESEDFDPGPRLPDEAPNFPVVEDAPLAATSKQPVAEKNRKVYISHGSNRKIVEQLKELLSYGDFEPVVSVETESTAKPVSEKVLSEMRGCGAGIIHVRPDEIIVDADGREHPLLNYNVLIEIGVAMALYGANYILLVEQGTALPSNLQGLYEARYQGDTLDHDATMKLLRTLKKIKTSL